MLLEMKKQAFDALPDAELLLACVEPAVRAVQGRDAADKASVIRSLRPDQQQVFMIRLLYPACQSEPDFQGWIRYLLDTPGYWQGVHGGLHFFGETEVIRLLSDAKDVMERSVIISDTNTANPHPEISPLYEQFRLAFDDTIQRISRYIRNHPDSFIRLI
ncbi:hypothetical protein CJP46_16000 [Paenibacillus sp. XY044]|nr:hypothetical protein CJP46_16000 [Paenibacillus sp. XY044]